MEVPIFRCREIIKPVGPRMKLLEQQALLLKVHRYQHAEIYAYIQGKSRETCETALLEYNVTVLLEEYLSYAGFNYIIYIYTYKAYTCDLKIDLYAG